MPETYDARSISVDLDGVVAVAVTRSPAFPERENPQGSTFAIHFGEPAGVAQAARAPRRVRWWERLLPRRPEADPGTLTLIRLSNDLAHDLFLALRDHFV